MTATYCYSYSVQPGKHQLHDQWVRSHGQPFWEEQPGFREFHCYSTMIGPGPDMLTLVEFEKPEDIAHALGNADALKLWEEFEELIGELETRIVVPAAELERPELELAH